MNAAIGGTPTGPMVIYARGRSRLPARIEVTSSEHNPERVTSVSSGTGVDSGTIRKDSLPTS